MRSGAPALLPIFRSQAQAEILAWLYLHPGYEYSLTDLARQIGVSLPTVHREAERLAGSSLVIETTVGRNRMLAANTHHPAAQHLAGLLEVTFGPKQVITEEFAHIPGASTVLIFGSWAARYSGEIGHTPNDVDVLVIGDTVDRGQVYGAADRAQARLGVPVNPTLRTRAQWDDPADRLSSEIRERPKVAVLLPKG